MAIIDWLRRAGAWFSHPYTNIAKPLMRGAHNIKKSGYGWLRSGMEGLPYVGTAASVANTVIDQLAAAHEYTESDAGRAKLARWGIEDQSAPRPPRPNMHTSGMDLD